MINNIIGNVIASGSNVGRKLISFESGKIVNIRDVTEEDSSDFNTMDFGDAYISAGFIDLHVNGAGDRIFQFCKRSEDADAIFAALAKAGTAYAVPVISATDIEEYRAIRNFARPYVRSQRQMLGLHFEGPFINEGKVGFGRQDCVGDGAVQSRDVYYDLPEDMKVLMTIAPEALSFPDALQMIKDGVILSFGHTESSAEECRNFVDVGVRYCTHLFNGMPPVSGRNPGLTGVCLSSDKVTVSLILDGHHLANETINLVWAMKRSDRVCLISDGMPPLEGSLPDFSYRDIKIQTRPDGSLLDQNGALSGTAVSQMKMLKRLIATTGARVDKAVNAVTKAPASVLGLENSIGDIRVGFAASFSVFSRELEPAATIVEGEIKWCRDKDLTQ